MAVSRDTLDKVFGRPNIDKWADLCNEKNSIDIEERVDFYINLATKLFHQRTSARTYVEDDVSDVVIGKMAGIELYEGRGITAADDAEKSPIAHHRKWVNAWIADWISGVLNKTKPSAPFVVSDDYSV